MVLKSQIENATVAVVNEWTSVWNCLKMVKYFLLYVDNSKLISEQLQTAEP